MPNRGQDVAGFASVSATKTLTAGNIALCDAIVIGHAKAGEIRMSADAITSLAWYSCDTIDGTYLVCHDAADAAVTQNVTASKACSLPAALFGRMFVKALPTGATGSAKVVIQT